MPVFAAPVVPGQIDSFDDINDVVGGGADPNWVEATGGYNGTYMVQALVGAPNEVTEGAGSMKIDFTQYSAPGKRDEPFRNFDPALDLTNYKDLAITLWVWVKDANDTRQDHSLDSRLTDIVLTDANFVYYDPTVSPYPDWDGPLGKFTLQPLKNDGWNKVVAPLRNFLWTKDNYNVEDSTVDPNTEVLWSDVNQIALFTATPTIGDQNAIYIDDMRFESISPQPLPYQVASFDDINDELWQETHGAPQYMLQTPGGDPNFREGSGSMMIDFINNDVIYDIDPKIALIPALDFADGNDWAISVWVWSDLPNAYGTLLDDGFLWEIILHDNAGNTGHYRVPRQDFDAGTGWTKVTARIDEFIWSDTWGAGSFGNMPASQANLDAIVALSLWNMDYPNGGNNIYLDDLRIEPAVEALSEAVVYNADYGTITVDGNTPDWAALVDSDIIDFNLADPSIKGQPTGDLHVQYRLAWDPNYLYILVEEQPGDNLAWEANDAGTLDNGTTNDAGTKYDSLALSFDFTNSKLPSVDVHMGFYLVLGLNSSEKPDVMISYGDPRGVVTRWVTYNALIANGSAATGGTLGSRVIEARVKWSDLESGIDSWFKPAGGIVAAVQAGYIFGCDPHLQDRDNDSSAYDADHGLAWFSGRDNAIQWAQGNFRWPTGKDKYSTDIRLVYSAGDLDFDGDVNFVDYAQFAAEWRETDCNSLNDFCNGADILIPMNGEVDLEDLGRFALRWLLP